jgi:Ca2+/H+ antiporter, TMEM165/GDT1 family
VYPFVISAGVVAVGEIGDKTQLLALLLATRFRRPWPIVAGIFTATLVNHFLAGMMGAWIAAELGPSTLRWAIGIAFIAMAGWVLLPDQVNQAAASPMSKLGAYGTTVVAFFLAEMGDKTQLATVALAARFDAVAMVVAGTTLGMLLADVPAVFLGEAVAARVPLRVVRAVAALPFAVLGALTLLDVAPLPNFTGAAR